MTPPLGPCAGEFRHDNAGGWGANAMVKGYEEQLYITPYVDDLGLDGEDVSGVVTWMMECYQRGIVSREELDGIDLTWGNVPAICAILKKIAYRQGIGDLLAEGLKLASARLGRGSEQVRHPFQRGGHHFLRTAGQHAGRPGTCHLSGGLRCTAGAGLP